MDSGFGQCSGKSNGQPDKIFSSVCPILLLQHGHLQSLRPGGGGRQAVGEEAVLLPRVHVHPGQGGLLCPGWANILPLCQTVAGKSHREYCDPFQRPDFWHRLPSSISIGGDLANLQLATKQGQSHPARSLSKPEVHLVQVLQRPTLKLREVTEVQAGSLSRMSIL